MANPSSTAMQRRQLLSNLALAAGAAWAAPAPAHDEHQRGAEALGMGEADGYLMSAALAGHCATCEFWGGERRVAAHKTSLTVMSLGWCNNPASPNFRRRTSPEHGPMATWRKWGALAWQASESG